MDLSGCMVKHTMLNGAGRSNYRAILSPPAYKPLFKWEPSSIVIFSVQKPNINRYISFDVSAISVIITTNDVSLNDLSNGQYDEVIYDMNQALHTVGYTKMTIYTDGSGNGFAKDTNGIDIVNKIIKTTEYTYPYIDASGNSIPGNLTIIFDDESKFINSDLHENQSWFWYTIEGLPNILKTFT